MGDYFELNYAVCLSAATGERTEETFGTRLSSLPTKCGEHKRTPGTAALAEFEHMKPFRIRSVLRLGFALALLAVSACATEQSAQTPPAQSIVAVATTSPANTPSPATTPAITQPTSTTLPAYQLDSCVANGMFNAYVDDKFWSDVWNEVGQSVPELREACAYFEFLDPGWLRATHLNWLAFERLDTISPKTSPPTTRPPTTYKPRTPPPSITIDCGPAVSGSWDWYRVNYEYSFSGGSEIVQWGMEYGDGRSYVSYNRGQAETDVYWHKYTSSGSYTARAWVEDVDGRTDSDSCTFRWNWVTPPLAIPSQTGSNNSGGSTAPASTRRVGAICRDGSRSSATGRGACSWHGGVSQWLYG